MSEPRISLRPRVGGGRGRTTARPAHTTSDTPPPSACGGRNAFNHLGLVVDDLDAALARLHALGIPLDHVGGSSEHRRSAYVMIEPERLQIELVAYDSALPSERNAY